MKNKLVFAGLLISVLVIGFVVVGCDTGGGGGGGTGTYTPQTPTNDATTVTFLTGTWNGDNGEGTYPSKQVLLVHKITRE